MQLEVCRAVRGKKELKMNLIQIWIDSKAKTPEKPWRAKLNNKLLTIVEADSTMAYVNGTLQLIIGLNEVQVPREFSTLEDAQLAVDQLLLQQQLDKSLQQQLKQLVKK